MFIHLLDTMYALLPGLSALVFLVVIHEWGHLYFLRRYDVFVDKFSVGFGKPFLSKEDGKKTLWQMAPVFLGGYVSFPYTLDDVPERVKGVIKEDAVFNNKKPFQRAAVMFGGPLVNIVFALVCFIVCGAYMGAPTSTVLKDAPRIGLLKGDVVVPCDAQASSNDWLFKLQDRVTVLRNGAPKEIQLPQKAPLYPLVSFEANKSQSFSSKGVAYGRDIFLFEVERLCTAVKMLFTGSFGSLGGLPSIFKAATSRADQGILSFLLFLSVLSLSLGVLNLLPIPGLDGGHLLMLALSVVFRQGKPFSERVEKYVLYASFTLLTGVIAIVNIRDILNLDIIKSLLS